MRIAHLAIKVDDLDAAGEFYEKVFGLRDVRQGHNRDHYSRHMTDGNIDIALLKYDDEQASREGSASGTGPGIHHFGFEVEDVDAFLKMVEAHGLEVVSAPGVIPVKFRLPGGGVAEFAPQGHFDIS
ncbi:VOC family protein [Billgrantia aerodenitrificans]|uniref:VOC family protein n=1 Tax=Billgrantia aerodenitrificans TaxID=2733483 RepID=A0ABS9AR88_9GAMM|nr:VOC family protein [Halomonas aerodenitrificans]MCE8024357.1 VOC family protein [Halomonas aerodenitrificans]